MLLSTTFGVNLIKEPFKNNCEEEKIILLHSQRMLAMKRKLIYMKIRGTLSISKKLKLKIS